MTVCVLEWGGGGGGGRVTGWNNQKGKPETCHLGINNSNRPTEQVIHVYYILRGNSRKEMQCRSF